MYYSINVFKLIVISLLLLEINFSVSQLISYGKNIDLLKGRGEIFIESFRPCEDKGFISLIWAYVSQKRHNFSHDSLQVDIKTKLPIDDQLEFYVSVSRWTGDRWVENALEMNLADSCKAFRNTLGALFERWLSSVGLPDECPLPPGEYSAKNMPYNRFEDVSLDLLFGRLKAKVILAKKDIIAVCYEVILTAKANNLTFASQSDEDNY